jgi:hypothetical protein
MRDGKMARRKLDLWNLATLVARLVLPSSGRTGQAVNSD